VYVIYLIALALIIATVDILFMHAPVIESLLLWLLVCKIGLGGIWTFLGHYFKSDEIAGYIGWPAGNPFQKEIAFSNLAMGISGLMCFFFRDGFWLATIVFSSIFLLGAFSVHIKDIKESGNENPGNSGPVFFADIIIPLSLWTLFFSK
jgi:hypothetical protein